mgnify:CR=1 FL=1
MPTVLHQVLAVEKGVKNRATAALTEIHKANQKADAFAGLQKQYTPITEDGEKLPSENVLVQRSAPSVLKQAAKILTELFDVTAQRDYTNCEAKADVVVDGVALLKDVPATHLLFLEKQLVDVRTLIGEIPTLDPAYTWTRDENSGLFASNVVQTTRTKKVEEFVVVLQPTKEHPGKHEKVTKDVTAGTWATTKLSGALPAPRKEELTERIEKLIKAVKFAREAANGTEVKPMTSLGDAIFGYLLR